jgi:N-acetyl-anhydromuramyl-L-alanine amidase AmpD
MSFFDKEDNSTKITPQLYGSIVNVVGFKATISYAGEINNNKVEIGVETVSSGWTRSSLQTALEQYPTIQDQYTIQIQDKV